jgi:uncharacterized protein (DUF1697 family)
MLDRTYLCLLRGINVSGKNIIKMSDLRSILEMDGYCNVNTYIQSGNIILCASNQSRQKVGRNIEALIKKHYGWDVPCICLTTDILKSILDNNPFPHLVNESKNKPYVCIPSRELTKMDQSKLQELVFIDENFIASNLAIYLNHKTLSYKSKMFNSKFEKQLDISCTTRNWRTLNKTYTMMSQIDT